tara:strand:- start:1652 stop:1810 length:159 start_codon:yes stop_codon:yes gene_type:complete
LDEQKKNLGKRKLVLQKIITSHKRQKVESKIHEPNIIEIDKSRLTSRFDVKI